MITKNDPSTIQAYLEDSSNLTGGHADKVVIPETQADVVAVLKEANKSRSPITISGGGTGTSGGRIPFGGIVISMEKINRIKTLTRKNTGGEAVAEAGVLIKDLKGRAEKEGFFYCYDPTEQTAFVGGTIATNASGARSFKYGSTRNSVLGLVVALADGALFDVERGGIKACNGRLEFSTGLKKYVIPVPEYKMPRTKSSAGYYAERGMDLIDLFIGQEGTLGCILEARLKLNDKPEGIFSCFAFFENEKKAWQFSVEAKELSLTNRGQRPDDIDALSIEYLDKNSIKLFKQDNGNVPDDRNACIFFEQELTRQNEETVIDKWGRLLSKYGVSLDDTWAAMNESERKELLDKRHSIAESMNRMAKENKMPKVTTDLAVPDDNLMDMLMFYREVLTRTDIMSFLFGHIGDNHLHMDLFPKNGREYEDSKKISLKFVKKSVSLGGTVSAEHGIGKMRREYLKVLYGEDGIKEMMNIKKILDPNLIFGRGNIFEL